MVSGCQGVPTPAAPGPEPVAVNGVGYLVLNAPITVSSRDLFITDVDKLRAVGAREIHLGINSPGGDIDAAQAIVRYMERTHDRDGLVFKAYNMGLVASAATYVFLNAQERYSSPRGAFLFHAATATSTGPIGAEGLRAAAERLDAYERVVRATMKERTHLTDDEAQTYVRRTVVLNSDDARKDGIVDGIETFSVAQGARTWVIAVRPATPRRPVQPPASAATSG